MTRFRVGNQRDLSSFSHSYIRMNWTTYLWINTINPWPLEAHILLREISLSLNKALVVVSQGAARIQSNGGETSYTNPKSKCHRSSKDCQVSSKLSPKSPFLTLSMYGLCLLRPVPSLLAGLWASGLSLLPFSSQTASSEIFLKPQSCYNVPALWFRAISLFSCLKNEEDKWSHSQGSVLQCG